MSDLSNTKLISFNSEHLELVLNWRNQLRVRKHMFNHQVIRYEDHMKWFKRYTEDNSLITKIFYIGETPLGVLNISELNLKGNTCKWGFYIGESNTRKGTGKILGYIALNYIFNELNVTKLYGEVLEGNIKSINFHEKLGFRTENVWRDHIHRDNQFYDVIVMSLSKNNWNERKSLIYSEIKE